MKTLILRTKSSFFFLALFLSLSVEAKLVGKIHQVKGMAFMTYDGRTVTLKEGMDVHHSAQIIVSDNAQVTVGDFFERRFHLAGGSSFILNQHEATLLTGNVWSQATPFSKNFVLSTANMLMQSFKGEFVATYSNDTKKTQLTVISGEVNVASPKKPELRYGIYAGHFTTAHEDYDQGYPRSPTQLGYASLTKTLKSFSGIKALDLGVADAQKKSDIGREIASVGESEAAKPAIKHIKSSYVERNIASVGSAQKYYLKKIKRSSPSSSAHVAQVRVIGLKNVSVAQDASSKPKRDLASLKSNSMTEIRQDANLSEFLKSYKYHQGQQHKHSPEVQRLIDDLKSY